MKRFFTYLALVALVLLPFNVQADNPVANCGLDLGEEILINVSDTEQIRFQVLGDTAALLADRAQSTSVIRLISKDTILDSLSFNTEVVEYADADIKVSLEDETQDWKNVTTVGLLAESDLDFYFGLDGTNHLPSSVSNEFLKSTSSNGYWTEYVYTSGNEEGMVATINPYGEIENKEVTEESAVRVVVEMPVNKACSTSGEPSTKEPEGEENASTGDLDIVIYVGLTLGLAGLAVYSYKKQVA